jgi:uncharacterized membrane protein
MEVDTNIMFKFLLGIIGIVLLPLGAIWSVNTLTPLNIEYSFFNWLATAFLQLYIQVIIKSGTIHKKEKQSK